MIKIRDHGPKLSENDVLELEASIGSPLPPDYRRFLIEFNGGVPELDTIDVPGFAQSPTNVQEFLGIGLDIESSCLDWNLETLALRLEDGALPIACDSGGNVFCLSLRRNRGAVTYYDLEAVYGNLSARPPVYSVAPSFDEFLAALRPFES